jgi:hypothetical protein
MCNPIFYFFKNSKAKRNKKAVGKSAGDKN